MKFKYKTPKNTEIIFTDEANRFVQDLQSKFSSKIEDLLHKRVENQTRFNSGQLPNFLDETQEIRKSDWKVRDIPNDLLDRRVEITGPVDRKMIINALNADVKVFMADFEDSLSPTWENVANGQKNLYDAIRRTITFENPVNGKKYQLNDETAILMCRVRGLHLKEKGIEINGVNPHGCLCDFGYYLFHNAKELVNRGTGPYFYVPKLQTHLEARLWNEIIDYAEDQLNLPRGTVRVTCLIETLPAVFEMDEILFELKDHIVGLNCGRWDYIFSYIKTFQNHSDKLLPDRYQVGMGQPFLNAYSRLLIKTCHKRGAFAMGGMAAFIPSKDPKENAVVTEKVLNDKTLETQNGHDGTWIAHPGLADIANNVFSNAFEFDGTNQLHVLREDDHVTQADLVEPCEGDFTEECFRTNIRVTLRYIEAWLRGIGCVPIYGLMEDAATAEISRSSLWQLVKHNVELDTGLMSSKDTFEKLLDEEYNVVLEEVGQDSLNSGKFVEAKSLLKDLVLSDELTDFLTLPAYRSI
ncbi:MAG: malate synthase A [Gammaproteobacteria bacterium TMED112]|nr:MAG: malate synthase A [Gammaproteobacteria bacterium TMED112]|tara:strand:+ start:1322 stop:2893 length:1572 start_codon:yes stop_codon:yes gene_type:complete